MTKLPTSVDDELERLSAAADEEDRQNADVAYRRSTVGETRRPLPYPDGWFLGCFIDEIAPGQVQTIRFMGQDLVLYRTHAGIVRIVEPYCPHLGAHLGHGGRVVGEDIVCPLHGLAYGLDGRCVRTGNGDSPPRAFLASRYTAQVNDAVLVWVDHAGRPPVWEVQEENLDGFSPPRYIRHQLPGYAHDAVENGADLVHFGWLHGLTDLEMSHRLSGPTFEISMSARWKGLRFCGSFVNYGVGYVAGAFEMPELGVRLKTMGYFTQVEPLRWRMVVADRLCISRLSRWPRIAQRLAYAILSPLASRWMAWFIEPDYPIWSAKSFLRHPKPIQGDRTLMAHRRWASQFYPGGLVDSWRPK